MLQSPIGHSYSFQGSPRTLQYCRSCGWEGLSCIDYAVRNHWLFVFYLRNSQIWFEKGHAWVFLCTNWFCIWINWGLLWDLGVFESFVDELDEGDKLAMIPHGFEPLDPVLSDIGSNLILLHVGVNVKFVTDLFSIFHEILINVFFRQCFWSA